MLLGEHREDHADQDDRVRGQGISPVCRPAKGSPQGRGTRRPSPSKSCAEGKARDRDPEGNGKDGARLAPEETPSVDPSARGLRKSPCMAPPHRERAAPSRGDAEAHAAADEDNDGLGNPLGDRSPKIVFQIAVSVSRTGMLTLPDTDESTMVASITPAKPHIQQNGNFLLFLPIRDDRPFQIIEALPGPDSGKGDEFVPLHPAMMRRLKSVRSVDEVIENSAASARRGPGRVQLVGIGIQDRLVFHGRDVPAIRRGS